MRKTLGSHKSLLIRGCTSHISKRVKLCLAWACYFSHWKTVDQPSGFMLVFLAKVSHAVHCDTVTWQAAHCVSRIKQSVTNYQNNHTAKHIHWYTVLCTALKRGICCPDKVQRGRSSDTLLFNTSSAELVKEPQKQRGTYLERLIKSPSLFHIQSSLQPPQEPVIMGSTLLCNPNQSISAKVNIYEKSLQVIFPKPQILIPKHLKRLAQYINYEIKFTHKDTKIILMPN